MAFKNRWRKVCEMQHRRKWFRGIFLKRLQKTSRSRDLGLRVTKDADFCSLSKGGLPNVGKHFWPGIINYYYQCLRVLEFCWQIPCTEKYSLCSMAVLPDTLLSGTRPNLLAVSLPSPAFITLWPNQNHHAMQAKKHIENNPSGL